MNVLAFLREERWWVKALVIYFFLFSAAGFAMFICEEAMQITTFAAFAYQSAKDWEGLKLHLQVMKAVDGFSRYFIRFVGWLNPVMWPPYLAYLEANRAYIRAMERVLEIRLGERR
jgi:hypothetical protein